MKHKGIIFDMDGTLWDSAENVAKSWNKAIADYGYERAPITKEDMYSVMGKTMDVLASIIFPNCTCRDELINVCYREENDYLTAHGGELYPDVEKTLDELSESYDLYIVSNCQRGYIESFFAYHGLGRYFKDTDLPVSALLICANGFFLTFSRGGIAPNVFAILSIASFSSISPTIDISM